MRRLGFLMLLCANAAMAFDARAEPRVLVLASFNEAAYRGVAAGIRQSAVETRVDVQFLPSSREALERLLRDAQPDTVVVPLGARAAQGVAEIGGPLPVVACFLTNTVGFRPGPLWQNVTVDLPPETLVTWIRRVLPSARVVGILYNPNESAPRAEALAAALKRAGFVPQLAEVTHPGNVDSALERLRGRAEVLVGIADLTALNPITAKTVVLFSYRHRVPVIGPSQAWTKSGALLSLEWDHEEHGRYCGQVALRSLGVGGRVTPQKKLLTAVNLRAASHMRIALSPDLVGAFSTVYE